jgi:hypothetical protein
MSSFILLKDIFFQRNRRIIDAPIGSIRAVITKSVDRPVVIKTKSFAIFDAGLGVYRSTNAAQMEVRNTDAASSQFEILLVAFSRSVFLILRDSILFNSSSAEIVDSVSFHSFFDVCSK